jgi:hypothetical protein
MLIVTEIFNEPSYTTIFAMLNNHVVNCRPRAVLAPHPRAIASFPA